MAEFSPLDLPIQANPDAQDLADRVMEVQSEVENAFDTVYDMPITVEAPLRPAPGMLRYADGVGWNPGYGSGLYVYEGGRWTKYISVLDAANAFTYAGYGGLYQDIPNIPGPDIGAAYQTITVFDSVSVATPKDVVQDLANNQLIIQFPGIWQLSLYLGFEHNSSNQGRTTRVRLFDTTDNDPYGPGITVATGRNAEATSFTITTILEILPEDVGHGWQVQIGGGDSYSLVDWDAASFNLVNVGTFAGFTPVNDPVSL